MHVALLKHGMDYIAPGNMTETWMTSIDSMLTKGWIGDILTVTCVREPVIFMYTFYTEIVHIGTSNHTFWNIKPWILIVNKP